MNRSTLQGAIDILDALQAQGIRCVIAGGCCRDLFFGVEPKDIDIVVVGASMIEIREFLAEANLPAEAFHMYNNAASDRIIGGFKLYGANIDIVVYDCLCPSEAIAAFDFNLNQFCLMDTRYGIEGAYVRFVGDQHWGSLQVVRGDHKPERQDRMERKWVELVLNGTRSTSEVEVKVADVLN